MRSEWINHDGSGCPAELDTHHRVDIKSDIGSVYSVRADKVNWENIKAWRIAYNGLYSPPKQVSDDVPPPARPSPGSGQEPAADAASDHEGSGVQDTLAQRGSRYGDFTDNAMISQQLKQLIMCENDGKLREGYRRCNFVQREALEMIAQKIARILNGDPNYKDNWHDIQGYARLAEERCRETSQ